jgi:outer membrane immunogenic protein
MGMASASGKTLVYLTGGLALAELKSNAGVVSECPDECFNAALSKTQVGWVVGTGVEHKLSQNWSVFGEFLYYDFVKATAQSTRMEVTRLYTSSRTKYFRASSA